MEDNNETPGRDDIEVTLVMEEIVEKLKLLDYESLFTRTK